MSEYKWCHGPSCHKSHTQDRVRGSKGNKVLRTRKIKQDTEWLRQSVFSHFCSQGCLMDFMKTNIQRIIAIAPRHEPLETPIEDPTKNTDHHYYSSWNIKERGVDTAE